MAQIVKNGRTHYGKQRFRCQKCGRQFVEHPTRQPIDEETRALIDKLLPLTPCKERQLHE